MERKQTRMNNTMSLLSLYTADFCIKFMLTGASIEQVKTYWK